MKNRKAMLCVIAFVGAAFFCVIQPAVGQLRMGREMYGTGLVKKTTFASDTGNFELEVDPTDDTGLGRYGAMYRFYSHHKLKWEKKRPYTLRKVVVTDKGSIIGFAYRQELLAPAWRDARQYFHVVIMDHHGDEILNDVAERPELMIASSPPMLNRPYAEQLIVDGHNDRVIVRVVEPDGFLGKTVWWNYRLSTGRRLANFDPNILIPDSLALGWVSRGRLLPGIPLMLVHFTAFANPIGAHKAGAVFVLIDLRGQPVWSLEWPNDYTALYAGEAKGDLGPYLEQHSAILPNQLPKRFALRSFGKNECVEFAVEQDDAGSWVVSQTSKGKCGGPFN